MIESKEHYRHLSSGIWTTLNINRAQVGINKNLMDAVGSENKAIMGYIAMKDEVDVIKNKKKVSFRSELLFIFRNAEYLYKHDVTYFSVVTNTTIS